MKQFLSIKLSKGEMIAAIAIAVWIIASLLVPLPDVNSLGM